MRINHNIQALNAYRNLVQNQAATSKNLERLSSGLRINRAADDAAGLAISEKMRSQIRGLQMAERNALDAVSLIQTAEGALQSTQEMLQRMRELAVQAANGTNTDEDLAQIQKEIDQLTTEINRVGNATEFNTKKLLNNSLSDQARKLQIDSGTPIDPSTTTIDDTSIKLAETSDLANGNYTVEIEDVAGVKNAILSIDGEEVEKLEDIQPNSSLSFHYGDLTMDIGAIAVGTASFTVKEEFENQAINFQIGSNINQTLSLSIDDMRAAALGIAGSESEGTITVKDRDGNDVIASFTKISGVKNGDRPQYGIDISSPEKASAAMVVFDRAIEAISSQRASLGSVQNRLEHTVNNLRTTAENLQASESRIRDVDMALEMTEFTKNNILNQSAQAMLAQANQLPQGVLQLLQ